MGMMESRKKHGVELVYLWNASVLGLQNYYRLATMISEDFAKIGWAVHQNLKVGQISKAVTDKGEKPLSKFVKERYGDYKGMKFLYGVPMYPIYAVKHKSPMELCNGVCNYTPEGREKIHKSLKVDLSVIRQIMCSVDGNNSVEYIDNRISKYCAQYGKCAITGVELEVDEIHCHHIKPRSQKGTDVYSNLVIIHIDMHKLIHATSVQIIQGLMEKWDLTVEQTEKLNGYRIKIVLAPITSAINQS